VVEMPGTGSALGIYSARERICDLGYLRQPYRKCDGSLGYRCPGEPLDDYTRKGGDAADTEGRKCLCNGLAATVGMGQSRASGPEPALVTAGDELSDLARLVRPSEDRYTACDVVQYLVGAIENTANEPLGVGLV